MARPSRLALAAVAAACALPAAAQEEGLAQAFAAGRPLLELRPRYNRLDESDKPERGEGGTMRIAAGWRTAPWEGFRLTLEAIATAHPGGSRFNDDSDDRLTSPYPLLPDPRFVGVNRAYLDWQDPEGTTRVRAGRQSVRLDNQRFVSDNDFRQIPQLFDGVSVAWTGLENAELSAAWFGRRRSTSGEEASRGLTRLHAAWNPAPDHALAVFAYLHDEAQNGAFTGFADNSYRIFGARAEGLWRAGALDVLYVAEWASQRPYAGGDARIDARYLRLGAGIGTPAWTLRYDEETKGSNEGLYGMQLPLTDFYAFNGWTLRFFNTPRTGLRDRWLTARASAGPFVAYLEEHRFRSDFGDLDYGRETDVGLTWSGPADIVVRLQHGRYRPAPSQAGAATIDKAWLTLTYTY